YEVERVSHDLLEHSSASAFMRTFSQVHVSSFVILYGSHNQEEKSYVTFAKQNGSVTVTYLKVRTNLYTAL
ncbi:hypothetical protein D1647_11335, partial [Alistipes sp. Z76]|nr:hypothetical protein [Alistipes sp. Z76]